MTAQTQDRDVQEIRSPSQRVFGLKAGAVCFQGAIAVLTGGYAKPGVSAANLVTVGIFEEPATGGGADGDVMATVKRGTFRFKNAAGADAVLASHVGTNCYVMDDQTVTITATNRSVAGKVYALADNGDVWVEIQ